MLLCFFISGIYISYEQIGEPSSRDDIEGVQYGNQFTVGVYRTPEFSPFVFSCYGCISDVATEHRGQV